MRRGVGGERDFILKYGEEIVIAPVSFTPQASINTDNRCVLQLGLFRLNHAIDIVINHIVHDVLNY